MALGFGGAIDNLIVAIRADVDDFERGMRDAALGIRKFDDQVQGSVAGVNRMGLALQGLGRAAAAAGVAAAGAALGVAFRGASNAAAEFETQLSGIATLLGDTSQIERLSGALEDLSTSFGLPVVEEAAGLYGILAAGITDSAVALDILTTANKLAIGGVTDVATAAQALTRIIAVYGREIDGAAAASDALFIAAAAGDTSIEELGQGFGRVAPLAKALGLSLEESLSAVGSLTETIESAQAITGLQAILAGIAGVTPEAAKEAERLGIAFNEAALQSEGFIGFLQKVVTATGGSIESLKTLFGRIEAVNPVLTLAANGAEDFNRAMENMENRVGRTDAAFGQFADDAAFAFARANQEAAKAFRDLGDSINRALAPIARGLADNFDDVRLAVDSLARAVAAGTIAWIGYRTVVATIAIERTIRSFLAMQSALRLSTVALIGLNTGLRALWVALGPAGAAALAIGAIATALFTVKRAAREAKEETEKLLAAFRETLAIESVTTLELRRTRGQQEQIRRLERIAELEQVIARAAPTRSGLDAPHVVRARKEIEALRATEARYIEEAVALELEINRRRQELETPVNVPPIPEVKVPAGFGESAEAFKQLREQVDATFIRLDFFQQKLEDLGRVRAPSIQRQMVGGQVFTEVQRLESAFSKITQEIERQGGVHKANADLLALQLRISERLRELTPELDLTLNFNIPKEFDAFGRKLPLAKNAEDAAKATSQLATQLSAASTAGRGLVQIADSMGKLSDETRQALDGVLGLVDAFGELQRAKQLSAEAKAATDAGDAAGAAAANAGALTSKVAAIVAAIGAFASIISSALSKTQAQLERESILRENTKTLERLRLTMEGFIITAASTLGASQSLGQVLSSEIARTLATVAQAPQRFIRGNSLSEFDKLLREAGTSLAELQAFAEANGIQILDSKGRLVAGALDQLQEALRLAAEEAATFGNSLTDQRRLLDARVEIFDEPQEGARAVQRELSFIANQLGPAFAGMFRGLDASTEEGRAEIEKVLREAFQLIQRGVFGVDPAQLGNFATVEEFLDALLGVDNALDSFTETVEQTTAALRGVPEGFKVALLRFRSETPLPPNPFISEPVGVFPPGSGIGLIATQEGVVTINGPVYVDARSKPIDEALAELTAAQRRKKAAQTGSTANPWEVV